MAFVIVSAGHLTDSRQRTLRARPVLLAAATGALLLMTGCLALGFHLVRLVKPVTAVPQAWRAWRSSPMPGRAASCAA